MAGTDVHLPRSSTLCKYNFERESLTNFYGPITAAAVDHDNFIRPKPDQRLQRRVDRLFFVQNRNDNGNVHRNQFAPLLGRLTTEARRTHAQTEPRFKVQGKIRE